MQLSDFSDKSILILGLGKENLSALHFLSKNFPDKKFGIADKKEDIEVPERAEKVFLGNDYLRAIDEYQVIIKSPGIPFFDEFKKAEEQGKVITSATEIFFDNCPAEIIGITGTKGKSTTSSLVYDVLKTGGLDAHLVGNIGLPALEVLPRIKKDSVVVFELSSFQLSGLKKSPHVSVITNLYPEHLDSHGSFDDYRNMKANITKFQEESDFLIYNDGILELDDIIKTSKAKKFPLSEFDWSKSSIDLDKVALKGKFNIKNITAALIIGKEIYQIPDEKIKQAVTNFHPLPHRLEFVGNHKGINFYNDSLATIPQATIGALDALGDGIETLITGGFDRGIDYSILAPVIVSSNIKNLILFPTTGERIWKAVKELVPNDELNIKNFNADSMEEAVKIAFEVTKPGRICLLSPASSSFNMFKNYEDRGNQFKALVKSVI